MSFRRATDLLADALERGLAKKRTVAQDVVGLPLAARLQRLVKLGILLPRQEVQRATLEDDVSLCDFVIESERKEQQRRDRELEECRKSIREAGDRLVEVVQRKVTLGIAVVLGAYIGTVCGRAAAIPIRAVAGIANWTVAD